MRLLVVLLCCVTLVACATPRAVAVRSADHARAALAPGDLVTLVDRQGRSVTVEVESVTRTHVHGRRDGKVQSIPLANLAEIRRPPSERRSGGATAVIVLLGIAAVVGVVALLTNEAEDDCNDPDRGRSCDFNR
jgi:hypothetical protein